MVDLILWGLNITAMISFPSCGPPRPGSNVPWESLVILFSTPLCSTRISVFKSFITYLFHFSQFVPRMLETIIKVSVCTHTHPHTLGMKEALLHLNKKKFLKLHVNDHQVSHGNSPRSWQQLCLCSVEVVYQQWLLIINVDCVLGARSRQALARHCLLSFSSLRWHHHLHFTNEKTETQRGQVLA